MANKKVVLEHQKPFMEVFNTLSYNHSDWKIWSDFITLAACTISNSVDKKNFDRREELYLRIMKDYNAHQANLFAALLAETVIALEKNPEQDFLGDLFQNALQLTNTRLGQFLTPYGISRLLAEINIENDLKNMLEKGYITVNDCCCGTGGLLIAYRNCAVEKELTLHRDILFVAQDIDFVSAMACYIQLSLLGCSGYVIVGNVLTDQKPEDNKIWRTPLYQLQTQPMGD